MENITNIDRDSETTGATFNIEAEQSLIGLLLINNEILGFELGGVGLNKNKTSSNL